jgi:hypothetical protein
MMLSWYRVDAKLLLSCWCCLDVFDTPLVQIARRDPAALGPQDQWAAKLIMRLLSWNHFERPSAARVCIYLHGARASGFDVVCGRCCNMPTCEMEALRAGSVQRLVKNSSLKMKCFKVANKCKHSKQSFMM